ncbi:hypothetical protein BS47DRAFT_1338509 [Hydnum rufescens UP504]|uniref:Uncharacterized protein n=1 Tax=Hydnum rufescens UP504 TaxID=1448309 RepID=A0A9P6AX45_9AGAM|nr:hypothetical protein BS47DRAFT_1344132 [Hydnum rufescens UP504]KAF9518237.1 hypothetical protein BS47DRAFT_1338509 [Hydnum rufescens UP504]
MLLYGFLQYLMTPGNLVCTIVKLNSLTLMTYPGQPNSKCLNCYSTISTAQELDKEKKVEDGREV